MISDLEYYEKKLKSFKFSPPPNSHEYDRWEDELCDLYILQHKLDQSGKIWNIYSPYKI